jgi:hypothetical protein
MKQNNVSTVSNNQAKWSNTGQSKNFIINTVPVKNEVRHYMICTIYIYNKYQLI